MAELTDLTVAAAAAKIAAGEISAAEYGAAWRAAAAADELNAYLWTAEHGEPAETDWTGAGESAPAGEGERTPYGANPAAPAASGPLAGVPIAIKDIFTTQGIPTTAGSRILEGYVPPYTATAVNKLTAAGAHVLGKTNMDEFAMGSSNENSGFGPVLNPWDRGRVPGGSSGGSAAAVAGGLAPAALGTDTGGSIRQPASLCGIVGLKPTYGAISRFGMIAFASSLDQCGPLTRDVTDAALLLGVMEGKDPRDSTSVGIAGGIELPSAEDLKGLRFGVLRDLSLDSSVRAVFEATIARIEELGGEVVEIDLPHAKHGISAYYVIAPAEASSNLARFDGVRYGARCGGDEDLIEMYERTRSEGFGPEVKRRIMLGTYALSSGYYDAYYGQAQKVRTRISEDFTAAFEEVDFVVTPTAPTPAFKLGEKTADPMSMYLNDYFTVPMSLAGIPAISIPAGFAEDLPVGFQIAAPAFAEQKLLEAAHALEGALGFAAAAGDAAPWKGGARG
jgi:aspartyl-tRNA(Asn)/glutamyl-tRNA(Gln) amidotransferase subunit A